MEKRKDKSSRPKAKSKFDVHPEFVKLLARRLGKTEAEVRKLLFNISTEQWCHLCEWLESPGL